MSSFTFIHAADLHLDSPLAGLETYPDAPVEQIRGASRRALDNLVDLAVSEQAAFVLLAGDIFDGPWKDYNTALFFAQRMGRLREAGIRVFMVTGNHDAASPIGRNLSLPDNVHVLSKNKPERVHLPDLEVTICGQSYARREVHTNLAAEFPLPDPHTFGIGLLHTALTGRPGHEPYAPTSVDVLASKGYDYWALGHVHEQEIVAREPWIVFPGAVQGRHIREQGPKGCTLVRVREGQVEDVLHRDLDVLRWYTARAELNGCESQEQVWSAVRQALESAQEAGDGRPVAVRLELRGQTQMHTWLHDQKQQVAEECRTRAVGMGDVWVEKVRVTTEPEMDSGGDIDPESPLHGLLQAIEELSLSPACTGQIPELEDMLTRLPLELKNGPDALDLSDKALMEHIQEEVKDLLLSRLLRQGGGR
ncbi:MAG: DNA repair exonuclease [Desulfovermiculus sp.]|nr:DNA repair exonuclease [Desulfovermiculus sp.]